MIILMGESVLSIVTALSSRWTPEAGVAAATGFVAIAFLAWGFFVAGAGVIEDGMARLSAEGKVRALLDTIMFYPYLIVASITMFAAGLATVVDEPHAVLSVGGVICLCGGLALFHLTNALIGLRYGTPLREVVPWAVPSVVIPLLVGVVGFRADGVVTLALVAATTILVVLISAVSKRRQG